MYGIAIMMNNYLHDMAAALLLTSATVMLYFARQAEATREPAALRFFAASYRKLTLLARISLGWIAVGGTIRLLTFSNFEWANAVGKSQVPALIIKHVIIFALVGSGAYFWRRLSLRVKRIRQLLGELPAETPAAGRETTVPERTVVGSR